MYFTKGYLIMPGSLTTKLFLKSRKGRGLYATYDFGKFTDLYYFSK